MLQDATPSVFVIAEHSVVVPVAKTIFSPATAASVSERVKLAAITPSDSTGALSLVGACRTVIGTVALAFA